MKAQCLSYLYHYDYNFFPQDNGIYYIEKCGIGSQKDYISLLRTTEYTEVEECCVGILRLYKLSQDNPIYKVKKCRVGDLKDYVIFPRTTEW